MNGLELALQLCMGIGLAACSGLRAFLPCLVVGALGRADYLQLGEAYSFLERTDSLIIFGVATVLEVLGDKILAVDHFLDTVGTVLRPAAGTVLVSAVMVKLDPTAALALGLIAGGGTAFTIHAGKSFTRAHSTAASPLHLGTGNTALSFVEDAVAGVGLFLSVLAPVFAFLLTVALLALAVWVLTHLRARWRRTGKAPESGSG